MKSFDVGAESKHKSTKQFYLLLLCALYASSAGHLYVVMSIPRRAEIDTGYQRDIPLALPEVGPEIHACVMFRIWPGDEFFMSSLDLRDWIRFARWSGVRHVHLYDNCQADSECQTNFSGVPGVHYQKWQKPHYATAQTSAMWDCISTVGANSPSAWVLSCDIDEYPWSVSDKMPNHLQRRLGSYPNDTSQILMRSMFFGGRGTERPRNRHVSISEHYVYRHEAAEGERHRTKPLFKAALADMAQPNIVHEIAMSAGQTVVADPQVFRLNHYWGLRLDRPVSELVRDVELVGWSA